MGNRGTRFLREVLKVKKVEMKSSKFPLFLDLWLNYERNFIKTINKVNMGLGAVFALCSTPVYFIVLLYLCMEQLPVFKK